MRFVRTSVTGGEVFGRLTVLADAGSDAKKYRIVNCRCECGAEKVVRLAPLRAGTVRSCGCLFRDVIAKKRIPMVGRTFGAMTVLAPAGMRTFPSGQKQPTYLVRCDRGHERVASGPHLRGGHGCLECFRTAGDRTGRMVGNSRVLLRDETHYLLECASCGERREVSRPQIGGIERGRVRACLKCEPSGRVIEANGKKQNMAAWAAELGLTRECIRRRIDISGWPEDVAVTTPDSSGQAFGQGRPPRMIECNGLRQSLNDWARDLGMSIGGLRSRLSRLPLEKALSIRKWERRTA